MIKHFFCALLSLATASAAVAPAWAGDGADSVYPPACLRPAVLDQLRAMLRQAGRPMVLEAVSTGENSVTTGRVITCAIRGHLPGFDTNRFGMQPIDEAFVVRYTLELRQNGIFIRLQ